LKYSHGIALSLAMPQKVKTLICLQQHTLRDPARKLKASALEVLNRCSVCCVHFGFVCYKAKRPQVSGRFGTGINIFLQINTSPEIWLRE
jgi:hypothetical protein